MSRKEKKVLKTYSAEFRAETVEHLGGHMSRVLVYGSRNLASLGYKRAEVRADLKRAPPRPLNTPKG